MYLKRQLSAAFEKARSQFPAVLITGPRQSGKTTFVQREIPQAAYASLDDPQARSFAMADPEGFLDRGDGGPLILDEIQHLPEILSRIKVRIDKNRRPGAWILTGSQQFHLMRNASETLAGRVAILELPPLSLAEIGGRKVPDLEAILWNGLYPDPFLHPPQRDLWLRSYVQTYVERDVRQLANIHNLRAFESFVALAAALHGQEFHAQRLASDCGVSLPTIKSWEGLLEASYLALLLPPWHRNYGKRVVKAPKLFFCDPALVAYLTRQPSPSANLAGAMGGRLFEGLVSCEAWKAMLARGRRPDIYHWRSHDGLEVDLLIQGRDHLWAVEIKLTATPGPDHLKGIERFKALAGKDAGSEGLLVCRVKEKTALPFGNCALPWRQFPDWLAERL